ncbi:MAG: hypothetical protein AMXMBFR48_14680 [Ignavibacteriales bacterium]
MNDYLTPVLLDEDENSTREQQQGDNSLSIKNLAESEDTIIKDYLYRLHHGVLEDERIAVQKILALDNEKKTFLRNPYVNYDPSTGMHFLGDKSIIFSLTDRGNPYELVCKIDQGISDTDVNFLLAVSGFSKESDSPDALLDYIRKQAIKNSFYQGKVLTFRNTDYFMMNGLTVIEPEERDINDIYVPEPQLHQMRRFIHTIKNAARKKGGLRFLLNGRPGTGKTELTRAVISAVAGSSTVLITQGADCPVDKVFDFISLFPNSLLIIDDIDFIAEDRKSNGSRKALGGLLQVLDGYIPNQVNLIATTNDHRLVDEAASRPGRFDLILDIPEIGTELYDQLILRETEDEEIIAVFTEQVRNRMRNHRVTGAFIVNFIKQLDGLKEMEGSISPQRLEEILELTLRGVNKSELAAEIGFN